MVTPSRGCPDPESSQLMWLCPEGWGALALESYRSVSLRDGWTCLGSQCRQAALCAWVSLSCVRGNMALRTPAERADHIFRVSFLAWPFFPLYLWFIWLEYTHYTSMPPSDFIVQKKSHRDIVKIQILIHQVWGGVPDSAFLTSS